MAGNKKSNIVHALDTDFVLNAEKIGEKAVKFNLMPNYLTSDSFRESYMEKVDRNIDHLLSQTSPTETYHPHHHLFLTHNMMALGYAVYGREFDLLFPDQAGFFRIVLKDYQEKHNDIFRNYVEFGQKADISEKVRVLKTHDIKGPIKISKADQRVMRDGISTINLASKLPKSELEYGHKEILRIKDEYCPLAALFKGVISAPNGNGEYSAEASGICIR
jgi:hypothetical protein